MTSTDPRAEGFASLPLAPALLAAVAERGFTAMTPIQAAALPPLLAGADVLGQARTGSGKTAAFSLPLLQRVDLTRRAPQALVLCPTRELAAQVASEIRALGRRLPGLRVLPVAGGQPPRPQALALDQGVHVVVGTPGRVLDHLRRGRLDGRAIGALVLDEADRMLELGFADEMAAILAFLPTDRQTALFSATFPDAIAKLSADWQRSPVRVTIPDDSPPVRSSALVTATDAKPAALDALLRALAPESALVFCNQKKDAAAVAEGLAAAGHAAVALHGDLEQIDRDVVMAGFRCGAVRVLVATDVAARGLDVAGLDLVINFDLPFQSDIYVHRIGRTGRAGRPGEAWSLCTAATLPHLPEIAGSGPPIVVTDPPRAAPDAPPLAAPWGLLRLHAGRADKLRPGDLLGALTGDVGLSGDQVGRIQIGDRISFVAIGLAAAGAAARGLTEHGVKGRRVRVERLRLG
jgi:ATP-independent RNA helicase DbpA